MAKKYLDNTITQITQIENGMLDIECENGWKYIIYPEELTNE